jgi:hypothetical protein
LLGVFVDLVTIVVDDDATTSTPPTDALSQPPFSS